MPNTQSLRYLNKVTLSSRVSSERNVSRKYVKIFGRILQKCENIFAKCENFVKTISFIAATLIAQKNLWNSLL